MRDGPRRQQWRPAWSSGDRSGRVALRARTLFLLPLAAALIFAAALPASAIPKAPGGKGNPAFGVYMKTKYALPAGTTIEWSFVKSSGQCIQYQPTLFTQTAGDKDPAKRMFLTPNYDSTSSCASEPSDGTWQVRITTPTHHVETGSLHFYFKAGSPNSGPHHAQATCDYFSSITCIGGSETIPASVQGDIELDVTLGPIS